MQLPVPNCPVFVAGPPGAGKSWLCRQAGARLGAPVYDTDHEVAELTGLSAAQLLEGPGEKVLRRAEKDAVKRVPEGFSLVSLGGGALVHEPTRSEVRRRGPVVGLFAAEDVLWDRVRSSTQERPLARSPSALAELVAQRKPIYRMVDRELDATQLGEGLVDQFTDWVTETGFLRASMDSVETRVLVGTHLEDAAEAAIRCLVPTRPVVLVEDEGVPSSRRDGYAQRLAAAAPGLIRCPVPGGEGVKSWDRLGDTLASAVAAGAGRQSVVVGLGGGATTDLAGMVAGLLGRGAPLVLLPSTLLAQVDASVGGKCAVNLESGKNLVGLFHPARDVLVDRSLVDTLPEPEWRSGMAETFKMALLAGEPLFSNLVAHPKIRISDLSAAIEAKARIVAADPYDEGPRMCLNLGHTVGHALERASGYAMPHGEAVARGLGVMVRWCRQRGLLSGETCGRILGAQRGLGLPDFPENWDGVLPHIRFDKKGSATDGTVVGLTDIGEPVLVSVEWAAFQRELTSLEE